MTRKDYRLIAATLKAVKPDGAGAELKQWHAVVAELAINLAVDNPRFDRMVFRRACGVEE